MEFNKSEFLSICIPTRNRTGFLSNLLTTLAGQIKNLPPKSVAIYVSDNASTDETPQVCKRFQPLLPCLVYSRNTKNIGADANIMHVRSLARGPFIWVTGDDELVCQDAVPRVLDLLRQQNPGLVVAFNSDYELALPSPQAFQDYKSFARYCLAFNAHLLAEHTLISSNIYRHDCFDRIYAQEKIATCLSQLYGMIRPLQNLQAPVVVPDFPIITIRRQPPPPVDRAWIDLDARWTDYFLWLREELALPELDPQAPSRLARQIMKKRILHHPLNYIWIHRRELLQPTAWKFALKRLLGKR